ncbi:MAG: hypothetical protein ACUVTZ_10755, partial [Armatimonadota bacterium]
HNNTSGTSARDWRGRHRPEHIIGTHAGGQLSACTPITIVLRGAHHVLRLEGTVFSQGAGLIV